MLTTGARVWIILPLRTTQMSLRMLDPESDPVMCQYSVLAESSIVSPLSSNLTDSHYWIKASTPLEKIMPQLLAQRTCTSLAGQINGFSPRNEEQRLELGLNT